ncbi:cephalosporin hydroxylase family protein [Synechococcus sp. SYN20]|uniref:CmcI family methyltransferase n=1 Tax=Synechococcus sp. SYN20 TaxID=1050714 RepID=UPI001644F8EB|nr:CmcI family methyltransferase [Synechococcus sp. SYN20]QNJ24462.1 cephalosporin hydroxylase family protein [Synechococcus sp. SYN20]
MTIDNNHSDNMDQQMLSSRWKQISALDLWHKQVVQHHQESYKGIGLAKFPQDLWSYEKLIVSSKPKAIIEIGINEGGFTRWLYDRLLLASWEEPEHEHILIGLDQNIENARKNLAEAIKAFEGRVKVHLIECNLLDKQSLDNAKNKIIHLIDGKPSLIIEDSGHTYETTISSLEAFSGLLQPGEWFVVEDTCVDIEDLRESVEWPRGALKAVNEFLQKNSRFERTSLNEMYTITCHPFGFLRKK